jgi:hypothetical protein
MPRLIEMIRQQQVPPGVLRTAAKGAITVPPEELVEILVHLSNHAEVGDQARETLATLDASILAPAIRDPKAPRELLNYFLAPRHRRADLLDALFNNAAVPEPTLEVITETASAETAQALLRSERLWKSPVLMKALAPNPYISEAERERISEMLTSMGASLELSSVVDFELEKWIEQHAEEIAREEAEGKAFALIGGIDNTEQEGAEVVEQTVDQALAAGQQVEPERLSMIQKLAKMSVGERVKAAMKGGREERLLLIRDGSRIVSAAVLASPKITDQEIETFSAMKNVQESVLRDISRSRKFMKNYMVLKNLCNNPRLPLDISLGLMKGLQLQDLKVLSMNKGVPETLRKMALKMFKIRSSPNSKGQE